MARKSLLRLVPPNPKIANAFFSRLYSPIADAATFTFREAGNILKFNARAAIAAGGFSKRWQNALRVNVYPLRGTSINPAIFLYHKIQYAGVFETGAKIRGKPLLWLPLKNAPKKIGRKKFTPRNLSAEGVSLVSFRSSSGQPLLGAKVGIKGRRSKISQAAIKRGISNTDVTKTVPLFVGVNSVTIRSKFKIRPAVIRVRNSLSVLYDKNFVGIRR